MNVDEAVELLDRQACALFESFPVHWFYPPREPTRPLAARIAPSWKRLERGDQEKWKKNGRNWFYAEVTFPKKRCGIPLAGGEALCFVDGWHPFTLWVDGKEIWKEEHAWKAVGPIADPFPVRITPGRKHRLVLCVEPTELPGNSISLGIRIVPRVGLELAVDVASVRAELQLAAALARNPAERRITEATAACLDRAAIRAQRWPAVLRSLARMERKLHPFAARAKALTVHVIGHAHLDMDWMWTWHDTVRCIRRDFKAVTTLMDEFPDLTFTHSQVPTYEEARKRDPHVFEKVRARVTEGRWENAAGTWVEGDLNMADGESVARHMLYAKQWTRQHLNSEARALWEPDTFGHPGNMPQLARLGEFDCYFHMRCHPNKGDLLTPVDPEVEPPAPVRDWTGIDGTRLRVLTLSYLGNLFPSSVMDSVLRCIRAGLKNPYHIWGLGDHGGALSRLHLELLARYRDRPLIPSIRFSTTPDLLAAWRREKPRVPGNRGETYHLFEGCFTTHASTKRDNRRCEGALLTAEALAARAGLDRRDALRAAWLPALFNQFHDILDGASVPDAYVDAHRRARRSLRAAQRVTSESLAVLARPAERGKYLTLINPLGFARTEPIRAVLPPGTACLKDAEGNVVPVQKLGREHVFVADGIPAFGSKTYRLCRALPAGCRFPDVTVRKEERFEFFHVETPTATVKLSRASGAIGSYFDKRRKREWVSCGYPIPLAHLPATQMETALNVFQIRDESPQGMAAWIIDNVFREESLLKGARVSFLGAGPVFARFRVEHAFRSSRIREDMLFYRDYDRVDFEARIDWREKGSPESGIPQLKVSFGTNLSAARARTEGPFVVREIPASGVEMPTQKWADLSGAGAGFTLLNDSKYGMDALGSRLRITLLRNAYSPDPESDNGIHRVRFAFQPHDGKRHNGERVRAGMAYNRPPVATVTNRPGELGGLFEMEGSADVVITALRRAEYSDALLVRLFNTGDHSSRIRIRLPKGTRSVREVNFLEHPTAAARRPASGRVPLTFRPFEVKTLQVRGAV